MANDLTWYSWSDYALPDTSTAQLQNKSLIWALKSAMKGDIAGGSLGPAGAVPAGAKWTVYYSCDSSAAGTAGDGVDRWGNTSWDATKLVRNNAGVHSWMVLQSPNALGPYYLILDWSTASDTTMTYVLCKTAPTGGTTSARPTATDEILGSSLAFAEASAWAGGGRCHYTVNPSGGFWFVASKNTSGVVGHGVVCSQMKNLRNGSDGYNIFLAVDWNTAGCFKEGQNTFYRGGATAPGRTKTQQSVATNNWTQACAISYDDGSSASVVQDTNAAYYADALYDAFPLLVAATNTNKGLKGQLYDTFTVSPSLAQGSRAPASGDMEKCVVGNTLIPLTVTPTL